MESLSSRVPSFFLDLSHSQALLCVQRQRAGAAVLMVSRGKEKTKCEFLNPCSPNEPYLLQNVGRHGEARLAIVS